MLRMTSVAAIVVSIGCVLMSSLPQGAENVLQAATEFELLSLDPVRPSDEDDETEQFHGWNVLGRTKIENGATRETVIAAFKRGVDQNDGTTAACFNPRHGIRVSANGETHDFVICFECLQVQWFVDDVRGEGFLITESPQTVFDQVLKKANVPLAEKAGD